MPGTESAGPVAYERCSPTAAITKTLLGHPRSGAGVSGGSRVGFEGELGPEGHILLQVSEEGFPATVLREVAGAEFPNPTANGLLIGARQRELIVMQEESKM